MKLRILLLLVLVGLSLCMPASAQSPLTGACRNWYEIFVYSYSDSNGDGIGDLAGVTAKLDYIAGMGYTGIWLMPVMPSPSYHKYDVTDYMQIDPQYGTMADMRALVAACHARDIRLIVDLPINHTSTRHPWFVEAQQAIAAGDMQNPYAGYYCFRQESGLKYVPLGETGWFYEEQFEGGGMPDLNLDSAAVRDEIAQILAFWLCDVGVDGFRLDAVTSYYAGDTARNVEFLAWLAQTARSLSPSCYLVGEAWTSLPEIARYYESGVDSFFLFPVSQAEGSLARVLRSRTPAAAYKSCLEEVLAAIGDGLLAPFMCNHDTGRTVVAVQARKSPEKAKFIEGILAMLGGATFTYYGEEIGMVGSGDDPNKRLPMYWSDTEMTELPPGVTKVEYAYPCVQEQLADEGSLLAYCRALNHLKLDMPVIAQGRTEFVFCDDFVCVMKRTDGTDTCYIAINFSSGEARSVQLDLTGLSLEGALVPSGEAVETGAAAPGTSLTLPPYAIAVLR